MVTTMTVNLHPGTSPRVRAVGGGQAVWIRVDDEQGEELLCLFVTPTLLDGLASAVEAAKELLTQRALDDLSVKLKTIPEHKS